jgi:hypothetical protein
MASLDNLLDLNIKKGGDLKSTKKELGTLN